MALGQLGRSVPWVNHKEGNPAMRFGIKSLLVAIILVAIPLALLPRGCDMLMGFDRSVHTQVHDLKAGAKKSSIVTLLGEPLKTDSVCCLPQRRGFEDEFSRAEKSNAVEFYLWRNGMNWYYCIGFDENDELVVKIEGCS